MTYSNQFFFITPKGLLQKSEIPKDCGLIEVYPTPYNNLMLIRKKNASITVAEPLPMNLAISLIRNAYNSNGFPETKIERTIRREKNEAR